MGINHSLILGNAAVAITLVLSIYTLWCIWKGTVKPHIFSVLIWFLLTSIAFFNMLLEQNAGAAAYRTGFMALMLLLNVLISSYKNGFGYIRKSDWYFLIGSLAVIPIWLVSQSADLALFLLLVVEVVGTIPTFTKAYHHPYDLSPGIYGITALAQFLQLMSLLVSGHTYGVVLVLYMTSFPLLFMGLTALLVVRRREI